MKRKVELKVIDIDSVRNATGRRDWIVPGDIQASLENSHRDGNYGTISDYIRVKVLCYMMHYGGKVCTSLIEEDLARALRVQKCNTTKIKIRNNVSQRIYELRKKYGFPVQTCKLYELYKGILP